MTPADRLLAAADLLDKRAGEATPELAIDDVDSGLVPEDIAYIATMHPEVGKLMVRRMALASTPMDKLQAAWLRAEANRVLNGPVVFGGGRALFTVSPEAVALADLLLAGGS